MVLRVFELREGGYRPVGMIQQDLRYSGEPWLEPVLRRLVETHGMEGAAKRVSTGLLESRLEG